MERALREVLADESLARSLAARGLETIRKRHTCAHRVNELLAICETMRPAGVEPLPVEVHS
jgi:spore maturation protein CgeB